MKLAGSLETSRSSAEFDPSDSDLESQDDENAPLFSLERLESSAILPRSISHIRPVDSKFRYFLDATQKTVHVMRIGLVPIVATYAVAGILERDDFGESRILPGSLTDQFVWLIPKRTRNKDVDALVDLLEQDYEETVIDPIEPENGREIFNYEEIAGQFNRIVECANTAANTNRALLERRALQQFLSSTDRAYPDAWIVVDGKLRDNHSNCIGLVKRLMRQHLRGAEAEVVFDLEPGHRTTAFRLVDRRRPSEEQLGRTHWYVRLWGAEGFEADRGLVHIEASHAIENTAEIDEISSWIYAERLPRATEDARWPTLIYPIHFLERILKRQQARFIAGWPS
jgi:hypothetical protein